MSDIIHLLPDVTANQIAAGEVVQRPASVVKELMENAVDAGGKNITLTIEDAGKKLIQVTDDGCGMSGTDARMSLERHATSKIRETEDLFRIQTLGFRGEALASIAAVSALTLKTRKHEDETGTMIACEGGEISRQEPDSCTAGTTVAVKNLFYNVPARRNFLKSHNAEMKHIYDTFVYVALANPAITFQLIDNGKKQYHLPEQNLRRRIVGLFGKKYNKALVPVEESASIARIKGFLGTPSVARKKRGEQFFFLNNRFIKNPYLNHAVTSAFNDLLSEGYFPFYVLFLEMDPSQVDINVHPTKTEVKFDEDKAVYAILKTAVRQALSNHHVAPSIDFDKDKQWEQYFDKPQTGGSPINVNRSSMPPGGKMNFRPSGKNSGQSEQDWEAFYQILSEETPTNPDQTSEGEQQMVDKEGTARQKELLQVHDKFIVSSLRSGLIIVHRYKAMDRILYEQYLKNIQKEVQPSQQQLFPEVVHLDPAESKQFEQLSPSLQKLGFDIEPFGKHAWLVKGVPADVAVDSVPAFMEEMLEEYKHHQNKNNLSGAEKIAGSFSGIAARKQKHTLMHDEMAVLIDRLFACEQPYYTPGGSPTFITIPLAELDKKFTKK